MLNARDAVALLVIGLASQACRPSVAALAIDLPPVVVGPQPVEVMATSETGERLRSGWTLTVTGPAHVDHEVLVCDGVGRVRVTIAASELTASATTACRPGLQILQPTTVYAVRGERVPLNAPATTPGEPLSWEVDVPAGLRRDGESLWVEEPGTHTLRWAVGGLEATTKVVVPDRFDASWVWVRRQGRLQAIRPDGTPAPWPHQQTSVDADLVDLPRGRFLREREGRVEAIVAGNVSTVVATDGPWVVDHDGTVWVVVDAGTEGHAIDGSTRSGPEVPSGGTLAGATRGVLCFTTGPAYYQTVTCSDSRGERAVGGSSGASPTLHGAFVDGLVHYQVNRQATFRSTLYDPVSGAIVWSLAEDSPGRVLVGPRSAAWSHAYGASMTVRGPWNTEFDGDWWPVALSDDGSYLVASSRKLGAMVHLGPEGTTRLPAAEPHDTPRTVSGAVVVRDPPDLDALGELTWPPPWSPRVPTPVAH